MEYHFDIPVTSDKIKKLRVGDIIYISGKIFTARDEAHAKMLKAGKLPFNPSEMALYHCGPLMEKKGKGWKVVSAGPTTSSRMEIFVFNNFSENSTIFCLLFFHFLFLF